MRKINFERILVFFFCFFCLEPFVGFAFITSDTQPTAVIIGILLLFYGLNFSMPKKLLFSLYFVGFFFLFSCLIFSYYMFEGLFPSFEGELLLIKELWAYFTPVVVILATFRSIKYLDKTFVLLVSRSLILFIFLGLVLNVFGQSGVIQLFVNRSVFEENLNGRGLTSFFPEQSYLVSSLLLLSVFMLIHDVLKLRPAILIFILSISSRAGQNLISFVSILLAYFFSFFSGLRIFLLIRRHIVVAFLLLLLILFGSSIAEGFLYLFPPQHFRVSYLVDNLLRVGPGFMFGDSSIMIKISGLIGAFSSVILLNFNFTPGSTTLFAPSADMVRAFSSVTKFISNDNLTTIGVGQSYGPLPKYIIDYGLFGLLSSSIITFFLFAHAFTSKRFSFRFSGMILIIYFWIFLPLANPTIWFLFAIYLASNKGNSYLPVSD